MDSSTIRPGAVVPDFEIPDEIGNPFRLSHAVRDRPLVIIFFPSVWGMMCAVEMATFRDMMGDFEKAGVRLSACDTNSPMSNAAWKEQMRLDFPMLSDFDGSVAA
ncbi:MAG: redoxin domain-containing protein, partial [Methanomassiliicoccales archaeon]|nr:redoxin domain-containing protein [Methanomassiliicoccales archaeon]